MSLYGFNIIRVDGKFYAHAGIQNEWSGNVSYTFKRIYHKGGRYYFKADSQVHDCSSAVASHIQYEAQRQEEHNFYLKYKNKIF